MAPRASARLYGFSPKQASVLLMPTARIRAGLATMQDIADDLRSASAMGKGKDGLEAYRGRSGAIYMLRFEGLLGCPPIRATVVSVLEMGVQTQRSHGWRACAGRPLCR